MLCIALKITFFLVVLFNYSLWSACHNLDDDDGSESLASSTSERSEDEESDHHLLMAPNGDVAFLKEKPVKLARESV